MTKVLQLRHHDTVRTVAFCVSLPLQFLLGLEVAKLIMGVL